MSNTLVPHKITSSMGSISWIFGRPQKVWSGSESEANCYVYYRLSDIWIKSVGLLVFMCMHYVARFFPHGNDKCVCYWHVSLFSGHTIAKFVVIFCYAELQPNALYSNWLL